MCKVQKKVLQAYYEDISRYHFVINSQMSEFFLVVIYCHINYLLLL